MPTEFDIQSINNYTQILIAIAIIIGLGLTASFLGNRGLNTLRTRNYISESLQGLLSVILRWAVVILVILLSLQQIGIQMASIWAGLSAVIVLLGVGLVAVWSVASNMFCSLLLLVFRPFSIGDRIEIIEPTGGEGLSGKVVNLNLLYTYLYEKGETEEDNALLQVPNNMFFQKTIRRWEGINTKRLEQFIFKQDKQSIQQNVPL